MALDGAKRDFGLVGRVLVQGLTTLEFFAHEQQVERQTTKIATMNSRSSFAIFVDRNRDKRLAGDSNGTRRLKPGVASRLLDETLVDERNLEGHAERDPNVVLTLAFEFECLNGAGGTQDANRPVSKKDWSVVDLEYSYLYSIVHAHIETGAYHERQVRRSGVKLAG